MKRASKKKREKVVEVNKKEIESLEESALEEHVDEEFIKRIGEDFGIDVDSDVVYKPKSVKKIKIRVKSIKKMRA